MMCRELLQGDCPAHSAQDNGDQNFGQLALAAGILHRLVSPANHEHNFDLLAEPCPPMYLERKRLIADFHP
jgi:hypothetical protein